jgi:threonine dehydratase
MTEHTYEPPVRAVRRPTVDDVRAAAATVSPHLPPTPLVRDPDGEHPQLHLKLEVFQPTGSFKVRGALNALSAVEPGRDVVTASAGNAGLGLAWAAGRLGRAVTVVVPGNASAAKVEALQRFPVELVQVGASYDDAEAEALRRADAGAYYLSSYNDPAVIAGQATIGVELDAQLDGPCTVVTSVGGGGLAAGLALWASTRSDVEVVGVEAEASQAVSAAVRAGRVVDVEVGPTLADGMAGGLEQGCVTVEVVRDHVAQLVTVTEPEIVAGMRYLLSRHGLVAEGSGAVPVAAVLAGKVGTNGPVVAVVSGRNIALPLLTRVLADSEPP